MKKKNSQTLSNTLNMSGVTNRVAPDQLKSLAILSGKTARRSTVDRKGKDIKKEKKPRFFMLSTCLLFTSFKEFSNHRKKTDRVVDLAVNHSPHFKYKDHQWISI